MERGNGAREKRRGKDEGTQGVARSAHFSHKNHKAHNSVANRLVPA